MGAAVDYARDGGEPTSVGQRPAELTATGQKEAAIRLCARKQGSGVQYAVAVGSD